MDVQRAELVVHLVIDDRLREAERLRIGTSDSLASRLLGALAASLGRLLISAGMRLQAASHHTLIRPRSVAVDPCHGCAN